MIKGCYLVVWGLLLLGWFGFGDRASVVTLELTV